MKDINEALEFLGAELERTADPAWIAEGDQIFADLDFRCKTNTDFYRGYVIALLEVAAGDDNPIATSLAGLVYKRYLKGVDVLNGTHR